VTPLEELSLLLRPAGGGLYLVSTGRDAQLAMQKTLYNASTEAEVETRWREALFEIGNARAFVLGIPSDVGAGFRRGANLGPQAIRARLLKDFPDWPARAAELGVVDLGDVFVVPQLLHDAMLSESQRAKTAAVLYPNVSLGERASLPVSPLSIAERALDLVFTLNPRIAPFVLGGDHSTAWPVASALSRARTDRWGIVQPDAHTDLLEHRLGIKYCFATWSFHANELLGRQGRLVQVGTRASRHDKAHWERTLDVRQFWADECVNAPEATLDALVAHLKAAGVSSVYFSNDIDGTDSAFADATGTPEPFGPPPEFFLELIARLGSEIGILGGDVMEVAPCLNDAPESSERTVGLAVRYLRATLSAVLRTPV
jgi:agmatinase